MARAKRLAPIIQLAKQKEQAKAKNLAAALAHERGEVERLEEMRAYHHEYRESITLQGQSGMTSAQMQHRLAFVGNLELMLIEQAKIIQQSEAVVNYHRNEWSQAHFRVKALEKMEAKYMAQEEKAADKKLDAQIDELVLRRYRNNND